MSNSSEVAAKLYHVLGIVYEMLGDNIENPDTLYDSTEELETIVHDLTSLVRGQMAEETELERLRKLEKMYKEQLRSSRDPVIQNSDAALEDVNKQTEEQRMAARIEQVKRLAKEATGVEVLQKPEVRIEE